MIYLYSPHRNPTDSALLAVKAIFSSLHRDDPIMTNLVTIFEGIISGFYFIGLFVCSDAITTFLNYCSFVIIFKTW